MREKRELDVTENPLYHDAWTLLKKYRTVVWNLELAVQRVRTNFQVEYGSSIEDFLESIYLAGVDFDESGIAAQAKSIERSHKMIKLVDRSVEVLRERLVGRGTDTEEAIERRVAKAASEMEFAAGKFDYVLVNDNLETAFAEAEKVIGEFLEK